VSEDGQYGPNTKAVAALIARVKTLTPDEADRMRDASTLTVEWSRARREARRKAGVRGRLEAWDAARDAAWNATQTDAGVVAGDAAVALVVEDLISREHFKALYAPWASVMEENKMSTTALKANREITVGQYETDARIRVSVTADGAVLSIGSMMSSLQNSTVMTRDELIELRDAINTVLNETSGI
jgi:hypothetical protein